MLYRINGGGPLCAPKDSLKPALRGVFVSSIFMRGSGKPLLADCSEVMGMPCFSKLQTHIPREGRLRSHLPGFGPPFI